MNKKLKNLLLVGDMRTVGNVEEAIAIVADNPEQISDLIDMMRGDVEGLAMRAADCLEKFSRKHAGLVKPYKNQLIRTLEDVPQKEVRWHLARILPRLELNVDDKVRASKVWLNDYYTSTSSIVQTESLQALYEVSGSSKELADSFQKALEYGINQGTSAVKARARLIMREQD